jgi:Flp pilus assembly protein TadG
MVPVRKLASTRKRESGGAAVEFAIVMPIFCVIVFGVIDYGWFFYQKFTLAAAIRDGVRTAAAIKEADDGWTTGKNAAETNLAAGGIPKNVVVYDTSLKYAGSSPTRTVTIKGTYTFTPLVGLVQLKSKTMTYSMTMMLEQQN